MNEERLKAFEQWKKETVRRFPPNIIDTRLAREEKKAAGLEKSERSGTRFRINKRQLLSQCLKISLLYKRGRRNAANIGISHNQLSVANLPLPTIVFVALVRLAWR